MNNDIHRGSFVWDQKKNRKNIQKHGISFTEGGKAFFDINRIIAIDEKHSQKEERYFCIGKVHDKVITVRFTYRKKVIRIFGAGTWRKGRDLYEKKNR